jgi:L-ascorbate metabolism protein UlaG (beta-lactamase superfamily)
VRITKFGHSCVRLSHDGSDLVIDPGVLTGPEAVDGVAGVLLTHEHPDHWTIDPLRDADPEVAERVHVVDPGEELDATGYGVRVVGRKHAIIHPEMPHFDNSGYVVTAGGTSLFHPGDSFELPGQRVDVYCAPVSAPWAKMSELLNVARDVAAPRTLGIHDGIYSEFGLAIADDRFAAFTAQRDGTYARPVPGTDL